MPWPEALPPDATIIMPARNMVMFPGVVFPLTIARSLSVAAAQQAMREERPIGILLQHDPNLDEPGANDLYRMGTVANILRYITLPDNTHQLICEGVQRFRVEDFVKEHPFFAARVLVIPEPQIVSADIEARHLHLQRLAVEALQLLPQPPQQLIAAVQATVSPGALADLVAAYIDIKPEEKQQILETVDLPARIDMVSRLLAAAH